MGVRGLQKLANDCQDAYEQCGIGSCKILFDGYNLLHELCYQSASTCLHLGANYIALSNSLDSYFQALITAGIEPYFLFDGVKPVPNVKWKTSQERAAKTLCSVKQCIGDKYKTCRVLPLLGRKVFTEKLREHGIPYCVTDFEADHVLCQLAHRWKCPLVSSDTDFLLMDLPGGVVSIQDFCVDDLQKRTREDGSERWVIPSRVFRVEKFMDVFGIRDFKLITLVCVICGSDTYEGLQIIPKILYHGSKPGYIHLKSVFKWLSQCRSYAMARDTLLHMQKPRLSKLDLRKLDNAVESYLPGSAQCEAEAYFEHRQIVHSSPDQEAFSLLDRVFWASYRHHDVSKLALFVVFHKRHIFSCQMEDLDSPSAWNSSAKIRKALYKIVSKTVQGQVTDFQEWHRGKHPDKIVKHVVADLDQNHENVLDVYELRELSDRESRQRFVGHLMEGSVSGRLADLMQSVKFSDVDLVTAMLVHWVSNSNPHVSQLCLVAYLVCVLKLAVIDDLPAEDKTRQTLDKHSENAAESQASTELFRVDIIHSYAQLQAIIRNSTDLMGLMQLYFKIPTRQLYSGSFLYNLVLTLEGQTEPLEYCQKNLLPDQPYKDILTLWYQEVRRLSNSHVVEESLAPIRAGARQTAERRPVEVPNLKTRRRGRKSRRSKPESLQAEGAKLTVQPIPMVLKGNKFAMLMQEQ